MIHVHVCILHVTYKTTTWRGLLLLVLCLTKENVFCSFSCDNMDNVPKYNQLLRAVLYIFFLGVMDDIGL